VDQLVHIHEILSAGTIYTGTKVRKDGTKGTHYDLKLSQYAALRYLVCRLGPHLHDPSRRGQMAVAAASLGVPLPPEASLAPRGASSPGGWAAGLLDADGSVVLYQKGADARLSIRVAAKDGAVLAPLPTQFGGSIHDVRQFVREKGGGRREYYFHVWAIGARPEVEAFAAYYLGLADGYPANPKRERLALVAEAYDLRDIGAQLDDHPRHPEWVALRDRWDAACQGASPLRKPRLMSRLPVESEEEAEPEDWADGWEE
jgi:hypothetical protein